MRKLLKAVLLIPAALLCSCEHREYEIVMSSRDGRLERTLIAAKVADGRNERLPEEEIVALAKRYARHEPNVDGADRFIGTFAGRTPDDVGGAGYHICVSTSLGSAIFYSEQFRGNDDLVQQVETRLKAADRLVDLVSGWLKTRVGGEKDFDKLAAVLDKDVRRDMKALTLHLWMMANGLVRAEAEPQSSATRPASQPASALASQPAPAAEVASREKVVRELIEKGNQEHIARIGQFLLERGYLDPPDAATVLASLSGGEPRGDNLLAPLLEKALTKKAGLANRSLVGRIVGMTRDPNEVGDSLRAYLQETPEYKARLAAWQADANHDADSPPDSLNVLSEVAQEWFGLEILGPEDEQLHIRFACADEPVYTNGVWDANAKAVFWGRVIQRAGAPPRRMPTMCFAVWATPDEAAQNRLFGEVLLASDDLLRYCGWHQSLDDARRKAWDAMVAGLAPGPALWAALGEFRQKDAAFSAGCDMLEGAIRRSPACTQPAGAAAADSPPVLSGPPATRPAGQTVQYVFRDGRWQAVGAGVASQPASTPAADPNGTRTLTFKVTAANEHLGHSIDRKDGMTYHRVWIDASRGRLPQTGEEFVVYWNNDAIREKAIRFEDGKTYVLTFRGEIGSGVMGYCGKCIELGKLIQVVPAKD